MSLCWRLRGFDFFSFLFRETCLFWVNCDGLWTLLRVAFNCFVASVIFLHNLTINLVPVVSQCKFCCWYKLIVPLPFVLAGEGKFIPNALGLLEIPSCQGLWIQVVLWDYLRAERFCIVLSAILFSPATSLCFFSRTWITAHISDEQDYAGASDSVINLVFQCFVTFKEGEEKNPLPFWAENVDAWTKSAIHYIWRKVWAGIYLPDLKLFLN